MQLFHIAAAVLHPRHTIFRKALRSATNIHVVMPSRRPNIWSIQLLVVVAAYYSKDSDLLCNALLLGLPNIFHRERPCRNDMSFLCSLSVHTICVGKSRNTFHICPLGVERILSPWELDVLLQHSLELHDQHARLHHPALYER